MKKELDSKIVARTYLDLSNYKSLNSNILSFSVDSNGNVFVVEGKRVESFFKNTVGAVFPKSTFLNGTNYTVNKWDGDTHTSVIIKNEKLIPHFIQPLEEGFILVGARCHWIEGNVEKNAILFDWEGTEKRRFTLGDGINDIRSTVNNNLWVAYFDEGVYGNFGWASPGPEPIGAKGFVGFDSMGNVKAEFSTESTNLDCIDDLYAMNVVDDDDIWLYYYSDFPIVNIKNGHYKSWSCEEEGAFALAVKENRAMLMGSFKEQDLIRIVSLDDDHKARLEKKAWIVDEQGKSIKSHWVSSYGEKLYLFENNKIFIIDQW